MYFPMIKPLVKSFQQKSLINNASSRASIIRNATPSSLRLRPMPSNRTGQQQIKSTVMKNAKSSFFFLSTLVVVAVLGLTAWQCDESKLPNKIWVLEKYGLESVLQAVMPGTPPAKPEIILLLDGNGRFSGNDGWNLLNNVCNKNYSKTDQTQVT